jgi:hypothetical protein
VVISFSSNVYDFPIASSIFREIKSFRRLNFSNSLPHELATSGASVGDDQPLFWYEKLSDFLSELVAGGSHCPSIQMNTYVIIL